MAKKSTTDLKLADALKAVFEKNGSIRRKSWDKVYLVSVREGMLTILLEDGENHPWTISLEDIEARDWEIMP